MLSVFSSPFFLLGCVACVFSFSGAVLWLRSPKDKRILTVFFAQFSFMQLDLQTVKDR